MNTTNSHNLCFNSTENCTRCAQNEENYFLDVYQNLQPVFGTASFSLLTVSLLGNFLVILTVLTDRHDNRMSDLFLFNVAIADLFYSGLNVVGECLSLVQDAQSLQDSCVSQPLTSLRVLTFVVSLFSLAALSVERYLAISSVHLADRIKVVLLFLLWLASLAVTLPLGFCSFTPNPPYTTSLSVITLVLPLSVILIVNLLIWKTVHTQVGPVQDHGEARSKRTVVMVTALVVSLVLFWMPYLVVVIYPEVFRSSTCVEDTRLLLVERSVNILAILNPALNPVLYCVFSKSFRQGFKRIHRFLCPCLYDCNIEGV